MTDFVGPGCSSRKVLLAFINICLVGSFCIGATLISTLSKPFARGFYCDDDSIKYPFHSSTIPSYVLYAVGFTLNFLIFIFVEYILVHREKKQGVHLNRDELDSSPYTLMSQNHKSLDIKVNNQVKRSVSVQSHDSTQAKAPSSTSFFLLYFYRLYNVVLAFCFGSALEFLVRDTAKYSLGRLRPHFLYVCNPDFTQLNCSAGYIEQYECRGDPAMVKAARLSFPSGHSSFSVYSMTFLILYFQARVKFRKIKMLRPWLQTLFAMMAIYTCISRVFDYKHHWTDVLAGAILGFVICLITVFKCSSLFQKKSQSKQINETKLYEVFFKFMDTAKMRVVDQKITTDL